MSSRDLVRRHDPSPAARQTSVSGEVTLTRDELAIQLRPTSVTDRPAPEREPRTIITRPIPPPLAVHPGRVYTRPSRWVFDREAISAVIAFMLVTAFLVVCVVIP
jgi:hypothetical protein